MNGGDNCSAGFENGGSGRGGAGLERKSSIVVEGGLSGGAGVWPPVTAAGVCGCCCSECPGGEISEGECRVGEGTADTTGLTTGGDSEGGASLTGAREVTGGGKAKIAVGC